MGSCCSAELSEHARLAKLEPVVDTHPPRRGETVAIRITRVVDGDTLVAMYEVKPCGSVITMSIRVFGVDAPEKNTEAGQRVRMAVLRLLKDGVDGGPCTMNIVGWNTYTGRVDARVYIGALCLGDWLVERRYAKPSSKRAGRVQWTQEELNYIVSQEPVV